MVVQTKGQILQILANYEDNVSIVNLSCHQHICIEKFLADGINQPQCF